MSMTTMVAAVFLACLAATAIREQPADRTVSLLFSGPADVTEQWGRLHFGTTPVRLLREVPHPGFSVVAGFPLPDASWEVYGQAFTEGQRGERPWEQTNTWKLVRAVTTDGISYRDAATVLEPLPGPWTGHCALARSGLTGEYLMLRLKVDSFGFAYTALFSADGRTWSEHTANPLFYDGDSMSLFWSPPLRRFVCVNKSLQPYRKQIRDHGGSTPALNDDDLRDRRVLMIRTSPDGRRWEPSVTLPDVWNQHNKKDAIAAGLLTVPDADDPPDLEFYSGNAFWYRDRAYMTVLNYAASRMTPGKHAPQLDNEWWTSADGVRWERPARGVNALEVFPKIPRLESAPILIGGNILFPRGDMLLGLPEDRISCVASRSNAEFSTRPFTMPDADLVLNAAVPSPDRPFAGEQAYIMVGVQDASGAILQGFEPEKCVVQNRDGRDIALTWSGRTARQLAGRVVRLRMLMRSASVYAVTSRTSP